MNPAHGRNPGRQRHETFEPAPELGFVFAAQHRPVTLGFAGADFDDREALEVRGDLSTAERADCYAFARKPPGQVSVLEDDVGHGGDESLLASRPVADQVRSSQEDGSIHPVCKLLDSLQENVARRKDRFPQDRLHARAFDHLPNALSQIPGLRGASDKDPPAHGH
jgi:hypothetical protein